VLDAFDVERLELCPCSSSRIRPPTPRSETTVCAVTRRNIRNSLYRATRCFAVCSNDQIQRRTVQRRRECQSTPIDVQAVFHSSTWEPTVLATSNWPIPCARRAPSLCTIFRRPGRGRRKTMKELIAANDFLGLRSEEQGRRHRTAILAVGFRSSARSRMPCVEGPVVLPFFSSKLAHS
jgi:hypothetical protein